ncbi:hypothetical protein QBC39DRAFT_337510 [Podospora conica]|nr:hypothetical protein QBC39DRAFT_337510 [Schizothecium conicum]
MRCDAAVLGCLVSPHVLAQLPAMMGGGGLRNERDVWRVFCLHPVESLSALFIPDDLVCGVGENRVAPLKPIQTRDHRHRNIAVKPYAHPLVFGVFIFTTDANRSLLLLSPATGRGGNYYLGFFYEPRGPVSYPTQFFFWEDLQNAFFLGQQRMSPGMELELAGGA